MTRKEEYHQYLETQEWKDLASKAKDRDGNRCRVCFSSHALVVHHRCYPKELGTEPLDWLTTLCSKCHKLFHNLHHTDKRRSRKAWRKHKKQNKKTHCLNPAPKTIHILRKHHEQ